MVGELSYVANIGDHHFSSSHCRPPQKWGNCRWELERNLLTCCCKMKNEKTHWTLRGVSALLGSIDGTLAAGTLAEFYSQLWNLFYSNKKTTPPGQIDDPVEQTIWQIHELGRRAREKDEEALSKLILINAAASLQLQGVATQLPEHLRKFTERCNAWLGPVSGVPSIDGAVAETMDQVRLVEERQHRSEKGRSSAHSPRASLFCCCLT